MNALASIKGAEVHIWRIDPAAMPIERWLDLLDPDERSKAERFRFPADRSRYLAAHVALRLILSRCLEIEANQIQFSRNQFGKPRVAGRTIEFSLSHSADKILIAVTADRSVGIDVEHVRVDFDFQPIVDRYFSAREKSELRGKPQRIHPQHFFKMWTRKEAILKMLGQGLSLLDQLEGTAEDGSLNSVGKGWTLYPVDVGAEYEAALAVAGDRVQVIQQ